MKKMILLGLLVPWTAVAQNYPEDSDWAILNNDNSNLDYQFHDQFGQSQGSMQGTGQGWDIYDRWGNKVGSLDPQ